MRTSQLYAGVFLVSTVGIANQIALMRIFSIAQWHHFAYLIISMAMLGFGASGTLIAVVRRWFVGREATGLRVAAFLLAVSLPLSYAISQHIPFETYQLVSQSEQRWYLLGLFLVLTVPFFLTSACVTFGFLYVPQHVARLYCANLLGSGAGALATTGTFYHAHPSTMPYILIIPAAAGFLCFAVSSKWALRAGIAGLAGLAVVLGIYGTTPVRLSEYKGISYVMDFPGTEVEAEALSPSSVVTAVASEYIRETPGQLSNYPMSELGRLPEQIGLFFDGDSLSPVNRYTGDLEPFAWTDYLSSALAYRLTKGSPTLIIGAGGGSDILSAVWHDARPVTAVEIDPGVAELMRGPLAEFSGDLYDRPDVDLVIDDGRGYLQSHPDARYNLIHVGALGSFAASAGGVLALNESYLYTAESLALMLDRLEPKGILSLTCWLKTPPRNGLKILATAVEACEQAGIANPERHVAAVRTWNNMSVFVSRAPYTPKQIASIREFARERQMDLCYYPGMNRSEANQYTILDEPYYHNFATMLFSDQAEQTYQSSLYYLRPATDERPYFFRFFKWGSLPKLTERLGTEWTRHVDWGYLTLILSIIQATVLGGLLVLIPLPVARKAAAGRKLNRWVLLGFGSLGIAFMFLEIALIQRFMLYLAYPIYSVAVVLTGLLTFSGLGSLTAGILRLHPNRVMRLAIGGIVLLALGYLIVLPPIFDWSSNWPDAAKIAFSIALLGPLAFCMGMPFPTLLQEVSARAEPLIPWAWAINGCTSVIGASLATFVAIHLGFTTVVFIALAAYVMAYLAHHALSRTANETRESPIS